MARATGATVVGLLICTLIISFLRFMPSGKQRRKDLEIVSSPKDIGDVLKSESPPNVDPAGIISVEPQRAVLPASVGDGTRRRRTDRVYERVLTEYGASLRIVLIAAVWLDGVCSSYGTDWRADLPRFLSKTLKNATVLVTKRPVPKGTEARHCHVCRNDFRDSGSGEAEKFRCTDWLHIMGEEHVDALIMFGSGPPWCAFRKNPRPNGPCRRSHPQLHAAIEDPWVGPSTRVFHFPTDWRLGQPDDVPIDKIVWENSSKPSNLQEELMDTGETLESWREICTSVPKQNLLLYIARMLDWKGQMDFLSRIDPGLIKGYTVEFIAKPAPRANETEALLSVANSRGIDIRVRSDAVRDQIELLSLLCRAKGLVHYARRDSNPRVIYQAAAAGTPSLVTVESAIPEHVQQHEQAVTTTSFTAGSVRLNADFRKFKQNMEQPDAARRVMEYAMTELDPETVWADICRQMGICA